MRDLTYRIYLSDALMRVGGAQKRWIDVYNDLTRKVEEPPAEAIVQSVMLGAGLRFEDECI